MSTKQNEDMPSTHSCVECEKRRKTLFFLILALNFLLILVLNFLTPLFADDYAYLGEVREANSVLDLVKQEYNQYMTWSGRSIAHFILRVFLYLPQPVFKIANSAAFVVLSLLMVRLIRPQKRWDCFALILVLCLLWLFAVDFSETILWEDGACNYLWTAVIILLFMSCAQEVCGKHYSIPITILVSAGLFVLGIVAGWCNENTSGGCLLFVLALLFTDARKEKRLPILLLSGSMGNLLGFLLMILSPGEQLRASYNTDESYSGFLGYLSRIQKITLNIEEYFAILLMILMLFMIILFLQQNRNALAWSLLYTFLFCATAYALMLTRPTQPRAFFGAGLFLDIALVKAILSSLDYERENKENGTGMVLRIAAYGGTAAMALLVFFRYVDDGTNVARIWRDENTRVEYIKEQAALGMQEITVPLVHTDFYNDYSVIEKMEMTEDSGYWINVIYEEYFGVNYISAIDYDAWEDLVGIED